MQYRDFEITFNGAERDRKMHVRIGWLRGYRHNKVDGKKKDAREFGA